MIFTACPSGSFGLGCSYKCNAYCMGNESCDPVTGICYNGCKEGWSGLKCGVGKSILVSVRPLKSIFIIEKKMNGVFIYIYIY